MNCKVVDGCKDPVAVRYVWEWGEEGFSCDGHRTILDAQVLQLGRRLTYLPLELERKPWKAPTLTPLGKIGDLMNPDVDQLSRGYGALFDRSKKLETHVAELEREREANKEKMREQELRIQDLLRQTGELKAELASAELSAQAAVELEKIEGEGPATQSGGGKGGKRR